MSLSDISKQFTTQVLNDIIIKAGGTKYTSHSFGPGFNKGDFYLSQVFRLKVKGINENNGEPKEVDLIVKSISKNPNRRKLFRSHDFFRNEINFYTKVIPAFEAFQKSKSIKKPFDEYPTCFATYCDGENDFLALEDVSILGYKAPSRHDDVSLEICRAIMKSLGRFHGLSLAFKDQRPEEFEKVSQSIEEVYYLEKYKNWYTPFLKDAITVAMDAVSQEYPETIYEQKTKDFLNAGLYDKLIQFVSARNQFSVIGHGDCWMPNFLMKKSEFVKIIDFQLARYASPVIDIMFFMYSCTQQDFRENFFEELMKDYHTSACILIRDLGSNPKKIFPFSALKDELEKFGAFGCGMGIESLPLSMLENDDVADLESIDAGNVILTDVWKISPLKIKEQRLRIADAFKHAIDNGFIK